MSAARPLVAIDARMMHHSGIGIVLRALLRVWTATAPGFEPVWCGGDAPPNGHRHVPWNAGLYSPGALMPPRLPGGVRAWYSPHYATALAHRLPIVCHVQDLLHITHPTRFGTAPFMRAYLLALRWRARRILTTSRLVKVQLQTLHGFHAERIWCTRLGPGIVAPDLPIVPLPSGLGAEPYCMAVGIVKPHKNWDFLLRAWALDGRDWPRLVALGTGSGGGKLRAMAEGLGIANRVTILPELPEAELAAVYRGSRGLVFPSIAEGFGLPLVEAMALGVPVVAADRSPMREIGAGAAFLFDPDWKASFTAAMERMLRDEGARAAAIPAGKAAAAGYSWEATAGRIEEAILGAM